MKRLIVLLLVAFCATSAFAQKKSKKTEVNTDSIALANTTLKAENDSLAKRLATYQTMYDTVKVVYVKKDFNPLKITSVVDSLLKLPQPGMDTLLAENKALQAELDSIVNSAAAREAEKKQVMADLRNAKSLLDEGVITEEEFLAVKKKYIDKL